MDIKLVDHILDVTITGFIYGAEIWLGCALALYVINRKQKAAFPIHLLKSAGVESDRSPDLRIPINLSPVQNAEGAITIDIVPSPIVHVPAGKALGVECLVIKEPVAMMPPVVAQPPRPKITCEPVVWKQWKVADLRRASTAKSCSVRTRDRDSRRNLPKADLIAQYEKSFKAAAKH